MVGQRYDQGAEALGTHPAAPTPRPDVVLITIDDAGFNDVGYQNPSAYSATPNIDRYSSQGVRLSQYYGQPSCSPSRAALMTGVWVHRLGFQDSEVSAYSNFSTPLRYATIAERLKKLGYATVGWGKWNIGHCAEAMLPWNRGFDYFLGYFTAAIDYRTRATGRNYTHGGVDRPLYDQLEGWASTGEWRKPEDVFDETYDSLLYAKKAAAAISTADGPLFAWLAFHGVHADNDDSKNITDNEIEPGSRGLAELRRGLANATDGRIKFAEAMYVVDYGVGLVVEAARDANRLGIVIVHSDNGAMPCTYGGPTADVPGSNYPLRSGKFQYFEGGVRVPAFVYAPEILPTTGVYRGLMHHVDWLPTIVAGIAGGDVSKTDADDLGIDGVDHWAWIKSVRVEDDSPLLAAPLDAVGPRDEIVFDISTAAYNLSYGTDSAPKDLRLPYADAIIAYRYKHLKLLKRHTDDDAYYRPDRGYLPNCTAMFCMMNRELYSTQEARCDFTDFLFNLTEDPLEQNNLADHPHYRHIRRDLEDKAKRHFSRAFYQPLNHISRSSVDANHAFYKAGDVIVPWGGEPKSGCELVY
ncbi:hypothetical protein CTAYLR_005080 [Chrysophaeum taylorii]|uniref:Sulfatase N-terminal domain-containing protein n=1 Tax=Chrysophaeum taylorii TaxID=2483200 RepID=A0AAD7XJY7_9STRA|nr:hypothetical protein CTAYLR_005080 [Chrysophaeum taylorii]